MQMEKPQEEAIVILSTIFGLGNSSRFESGPWEMGGLEGEDLIVV